MTPILGLALHALDFNVSYLECFRIKESFLENGKIEMIPPEEETDAKNREQFIRIGRIPYCCLEVVIDREKFYVSAKHFKIKDEKVLAMLSPQCYRDFVGVFAHQNEETKSGIYLENFSETERVVWQKRGEKDERPELFAEYSRAIKLFGCLIAPLIVNQHFFYLKIKLVDYI